jgi:hypothetical protein
MAQTPGPAAAAPPAPAQSPSSLLPSLPSLPSLTSIPITFGGYAEVYYQYNFNQPSNGITNDRGFDNRDRAFTLSNAALDAQWDASDVVGRITLQVGSTPSTYYLAEPDKAGTGATSASNAELWKYVQQAYVGYRFPVRNGLLVLAGLFLSPIGPEGIAVKDNWNWSRSNLFFGLPFYHAGARATLSITDEWAATLAVYNGWNNVGDNNDSPSVSAQITYTKPDKLSVGVLYFGGVERSTGAPEGAPWRHLFDAQATWTVHPAFSLMAHADAGFERNVFGTSSWAAGALSARVKVLSWLYATVAQSAQGKAAAIFWPVEWVSSGTATLEARLREHVSFRLEYRHDHAAGDMFFGGQVTGDGKVVPYVPNRPSQDTLTLGATAWF